MSSRHLARPSRNTRRCGSCHDTVLALVRQRMAAGETLISKRCRERLSVSVCSATFACSSAGICSARTGWLGTGDSDIAGQKSLWPACPPFRCILRMALLACRSSRATGGPRNRMTSSNLLNGSQSLWELFLHWSRPPRLRNSQRSSYAREHGNSNASQYQTGQHGDRQYIVLYALPGRRIRASEDNALYFVVYPATSLECVRRGLGGEIVEVCLEEPEGLWMRVSRLQCVAVYA